MISLEAAELLLGGEFGPEAIDSFVRRRKRPMSEILELRRELADRSERPLVPRLQPGETRPLVRATPDAGAPGSFLNPVCATLLYAHSAAIFDPLEETPFGPHRGTTPQEQTAALGALSALAIVKPLVQAGTLVLVPKDLLPDVKLDFRRVYRRLEGGRAQIFAVLKAGPDEGELHLRPRASSYVDTLDLVAKTGWSIHTAPIAVENLGRLRRYAVKQLLRDGRRRLRGQRLRSAFLNRFDSFAIDTLTRVPVPDLSDLGIDDIQLLRDEDAFGSWRVELTGVMAEYERNLDAVVPGAEAIARERLSMSAEQVERTIDGSRVLSAIRAGIGSFAVAGSASLAAFPILSAEGRRDALGVAVGTSLLEAGRRLIFCERSEAAVARRRHYRAAEAIFEAADAR